MDSFRISGENVQKINSRLSELENITDDKTEIVGCSGCSQNEKRCGILLTKKCQLKCVYCYEKNKNKETMDFPTAKKIIDTELEDGSKRRIHFDLFGGEPFMAFDVMQQIVSYLKELKGERDFYITTITNGVAIHGEIQEWLVKNRDIIECPLSLDGTKEMQEVNRPHSFDRIDLDFFTRELPGTRAKMTISPNTLDKLAEGTIFLHERRFSPQNWLAYGISWPEDASETLKRELTKLIAYYLDNLTMDESLLLKLPYRDICGRYRFCDAGETMAMYDIDGQKWPCHMFLPMALGEEKARNLASVNLYLDKSKGEYCDEECQNCPIRYSCVVCHGINYNLYGNINGKEPDICKLTKIIYSAKAYLAAEKWLKGCYSNLSEIDEKKLLTAICKCQSL